MIPKPLEVKAINENSISLRFEDGTKGIVNLSDLITEPYFTDLKNIDFFNQVFITKNRAAIAWNEDLELCANSLYLEIKGLTFEQWETNQKLYATN